MAGLIKRIGSRIDPNPTLPHTIVANGWQTVKFFADVGEAIVNLPIAEGKW